MKQSMDRRQFIKTAAGGMASAAALGVMGELPHALAEEKPAPLFPGKKQFAGSGTVRKVTEDILYIGVDDRRIALFENVYPVPRGVSYNSYLLLDEKTVLFDTVDRTAINPFFENLETALKGRGLDYMVIQHMEPDHSAALSQVMARYPGVKLLCSAAAAKIINQFFDFRVEDWGYIVKEGMELSTGKHNLTFVEAPMVHWPEVIVTYDSTDKVLFSADAFGTFGALGGNLFADEVNFKEEWLSDARRYYTNIVGKYGQQVQDVLKKAATLDIQMLLPLHGPLWREDLGWLLDKYDKWSSYTPEEPEAALVMYGSIYGGTENAANLLAKRLSQGGQRNVATYDVSKTHVSELIAEAFRCGHIALCSVTYNMDVFTPMKNALNDFAAHNLQNRSYSLVENGSWSPAAAAKMEAILGGMKNMRKVGDTVTLLSTPNEETAQQLDKLGDDILAALGGAAPSQDTAAQAAPAVAWKCRVCGYIYEGDPLPDNYTCPVCGVDATFFDKVEG